MLAQIELPLAIAPCDWHEEEGQLMIRPVGRSRHGSTDVGSSDALIRHGAWDGPHALQMAGRLNRRGEQQRVLAATDLLGDGNEAPIQS